MTFWDTSWATMWGALAGALVGAAAAWLFALDLRRRERQETDRSRLDAAVAEVVRLLGEFGGAVQAFDFSLRVGSPGVVAGPPHVARQQLLSAIIVALMAAGDDGEPLHATLALVTAQDEKAANRRLMEFEHAAHMLVKWRRGQTNTADAANMIDGGPPPIPPEVSD
jgi:hypothetical protein